MSRYQKGYQLKGEDGLASVATTSASKEQHAALENAPLSPRWDGSTNCFAHADGRRVDLRVAHGDFPSLLSLKRGLGGLEGLRWSPTEDRVAAVHQGALTIVARGPKGWVERPPEPPVSAHDLAWSPDGTRLYAAVSEPLPGSPAAARATFVRTLDRDGRELARFQVPSSTETCLAVHPDGRSLAVAHGHTAGVYDTSGAMARHLPWGMGARRIRFDPSGELLCIMSDRRTTVIDREDRGLLHLVDTDQRRVAWLGPREIVAYLFTKKGSPLPEEERGLYRISIYQKSSEAPVLIARCPPPEGLDVSPEGRFIGVCAQKPLRIELYDASSGALARTLRIPRGDEGARLAFTRQGDVSAAVSHQKLIYLFGATARHALLTRAAPTEADRRRATEKYFDAEDAALREANKRAGALQAEGFSLASIDPAVDDEARERTESLRRIGASKAGALVRVAFAPGPGPRSDAAPAVRFRGAPALPEGYAIPACPSCKKPMTCLAEIPLPASLAVAGGGLVQVFFCESGAPPCVVETKARALGPEKSKLVRVVPRADAAAPSDGNEVSFSEELNDVPMAKDELCFQKPLTFPKALKAIKMQRDEWPGPQGGDKLGGYPRWTQDPEYPACPACAAAMTELVAQFASGGATGVPFGDRGTAYVLRCPTHRDQLELLWQ